MWSRAAIRVVVALVFFSGATWFAMSDAVANRTATVAVTPSTTQVGDRLLVQLTGWPTGVVTATVCGNAARRGSTDCDQIGGASTSVPAGGSAALIVDVLAPPVGCPCVVRASTTNGAVARSAPITILDMPDGTDLEPTGLAASTDALSITASVSRSSVPWPQSWFPAFAGPAHHDLVLRITNHSDSEVSGLSVVGVVGHQKSDDGEPLTGAIAPIPAHKTRTTRVPFTLPAPVRGNYVVRGSVYGLAAPIEFSVQTSSEPWALEIVVPVVLLLLAQLLRRRDRRRRAAEETLGATVASTVAESSPAVGPVVGARYGVDSYDQPANGRAATGDPTIPVGGEEAMSDAAGVPRT
jgi:hypothetical protein